MTFFFHSYLFGNNSVGFKIEVGHVGNFYFHRVKPFGGRKINGRGLGAGAEQVGLQLRGVHHAAFLQHPIEVNAQDGGPHPLSGNVRELKAVVKLATVLAEGGLIRSPDLSLRGPAPAADNGVPRTLRKGITQLVQECLDALGGDVLATANRLGVGTTIYRMIKQQ